MTTDEVYRKTLLFIKKYWDGDMYNNKGNTKEWRNYHRSLILEDPQKQITDYLSPHGIVCLYLIASGVPEDQILDMTFEQSITYIYLFGEN